MLLREAGPGLGAQHLEVLAQARAGVPRLDDVVDETALGRTLKKTGGMIMRHVGQMVIRAVW